MEETTIKLKNFDWDGRDFSDAGGLFRQPLRQSGKNCGGAQGGILSSAGAVFEGLAHRAK
jgi:hypothetical protein